jgi:hypothetical protein
MTIGVKYIRRAKTTNIPKFEQLKDSAEQSNYIKRLKNKVQPKEVRIYESTLKRHCR